MKLIIAFTFLAAAATVGVLASRPNSVLQRTGGGKQSVRSDEECFEPVKCCALVTTVEEIGLDTVTLLDHDNVVGVGCIEPPTPFCPPGLKKACCIGGVLEQYTYISLNCTSIDA